MLAGLSSVSISQVLIAAAAGLVVAATIAVWRRAHRTLGLFVTALKSLEAFTAAWTKAAGLETLIREDAAELAEVRAQLGKARNPDWPSLEEYLHEMRHEQKNVSTKLQLAVDALMAVSGQLKALVAHFGESDAT